MEEPRKCRICNEDIRNGNRVFCSDECKKENKNRNRRKSPNEFECIICKTPFIQKRKDNITCSTSCSQLLWIKNNPEKDMERHNGERAKIRKKNWIKNNRQRFRDIQNRYKAKRYYSDVNYRLNYSMGNAIRNGINDKGFKKWETIVGYSIMVLKEHLTKFAPNGFTWENYLKGGFHIDHIIPQSMYAFESY